MKMPHTRFGWFTLMFLTEAVSFFIVVANTRAFTHGTYIWTAITDTLFSAQTVVMGKLMIDNQSARSWAA